MTIVTCTRFLKIRPGSPGDIAIEVDGATVWAAEITEIGPWSAHIPWPGEDVTQVLLGSYEALLDHSASPETITQAVTVTVRTGAQVLATGTATLTITPKYSGVAVTSHRITVVKKPARLPIKIVAQSDTATEGGVTFTHPASGTSKTFTYALARHKSIGGLVKPPHYL